MTLHFTQNLGQGKNIRSFLQPETIHDSVFLGEFLGHLEDFGPIQYDGLQFGLGEEEGYGV